VKEEIVVEYVYNAIRCGTFAGVHELPSAPVKIPSRDSVNKDDAGVDGKRARALGLIEGKAASLDNEAQHNSRSQREECVRCFNHCIDSVRGLSTSAWSSGLKSNRYDAIPRVLGPSDVTREV